MSFDRIAQLFPWATANEKKSKNKRKAFLRYIAPAPPARTYSTTSSRLDAMDQASISRRKRVTKNVTSGIIHQRGVNRTNKRESSIVDIMITCYIVLYSAKLKMTHDGQCLIQF